MKFSILKFLIFFLLTFCNLIVSQSYNFRNFSVKDGLPDAFVTSIAQTENGFLYLSTQNGLSRFDGKNFTNFNKNNGLPTNEIELVFEYEPNKLLLATYNGLSIFDGETFTNYSKYDGLTNDTLYTLFKYGNKILVGTKSGISVFVDNKFIDNSEFDFFDKMRVFAIEYDINNNLFVGTNKGLFIIHNGKIITLKKNIIVYDLELIKDGTLICGTTEGVFYFNDDNLVKDNNLDSRIIYKIMLDNNSQIWFGTDSGIVKKNDNIYKNYPTNNYFQAKECYYVLQDKELNYWFGTDSGIYLFDDGKFTLYDRRHGVNSMPWSIIERSNGELWAATDVNKVVELNGYEFSEIPILSNLGQTIWSLFEDSDKNVWFGADNGAYRLDVNNSLSHFTSKNGFTNDAILSVIEANGYLWFTSYSSGIYKYDGNIFHNISLKNAATTPISAAAIGFDSSLWFISDSGLDRLKNSKQLSFPKQDSINLYNYYSIQIDSLNESILLGSAEGGLIIYKPNELKPDKILAFVSTADGLNDNSVYFTIFNKDKSVLWIGTNKGLNRLDYKHFIETGKILVKSYNSYDGFPSIECNQLGALIDSKGTFWYSTIVGIVKYDETKENDLNIISSPFLSHIEINYKNIDLKDFGTQNKNALVKYDNIKFPYNMNNFTFHFSSIYFTNPLNVLFKYRLLGSNDAFSPFTRNQYVTYSSLAPGKYTFELISYTDNGTKASPPILFAFEIETPFWKSYFFYFTILALFLFLIYVIYRIRIAAVKENNNKLIKLYNENILFQKQLLESEKDYKGLFENAHNAILIIDIGSLSIINANNSAEILYGYGNNELINLSTTVLFENIENLNKLIENVTNNNNVKEFRTTHYKKDGNKIILSINASNTKYRNKPAIVALLRDITDEEETKKYLLFAKEAAEKSNKLKSEFLAQISHEIRTPINTVLGYVSLLEDLLENENDKEIDALFMPIQRSSQRIIRTIDLILDMSEVNSGTFELHIKEIDIAEALNLIVIEQRQAAKSKGLELKFTNNIGATSLSIDEYTFGQIFINLIDNAIKYTKEGFINVILSKKQNNIVIEIVDSGIGISEEFIPTIFDAFTQEEQGYTRKYEGNGLGLALVKNYVEINKGTISVESTKGKGTIFRIEFNL